MKRSLSFLMTLVLLVGSFSFPALAEGEWVCVNCGQTNYYMFCISCGAGRPESRTCLGCGHVALDGAEAKFCSRCGMAYDAIDPQKKVYYEQAEQLEAAGNWEQARLMYMKACGYKDALKRAYDIGYEKLYMGRLAGDDGYVLALMADGKIRHKEFYLGNKFYNDSIFNLKDLTAELKVICGKSSSVYGLTYDGMVVRGEGLDKYVDSWKNIVAIDSAGSNIVGIDEKGRVYYMGFNHHGEGSVSDWTDIVDVACGSTFTVGLKSDGTVVATGDNRSGKCDVSQWRDIVDVCAGSSFVMGLKADGTVVATGYNEYGQCNVSEWKDIKAISAGWNHAVGLRRDGTVVAVGKSSYGKLEVTAWQSIVQVLACGDMTVGVQKTGELEFAGFGKEEYYKHGKMDLW